MLEASCTQYRAKAASPGGIRLFLGYTTIVNHKDPGRPDLVFRGNYTCYIADYDILDLAKERCSISTRYSKPGLLDQEFEIYKEETGENLSTGVL